MIKLKDSYQEVYMIINQLKLSEYEKIPSEVIEFYDINRNKEYKINQNINDMKISSKASKILLNIYYNYIINEKEKGIIEDIIILRKKRNNKLKNISLNDLFEENFIKNDSLKKTDLIIGENKNESRIKNIFYTVVSFIKSIFK